MNNKYKCEELVRVSGLGEKFGKVENKLGFIIEKDEYFNNYCIDLVCGKKDWYNVESIKRVFKENGQKRNTYQIRLCTTQIGYNLLKKRLKENRPISNNKFSKLDIYKKIDKNNNIYIIIGWKSTTWPVSNKSVLILKNTLQEFKKYNIPFQYVKLNENVLTDIEIITFSNDDKNVEVFSVERKIKIK